MSANLSDIAFSVIIKNDGIDDIVFKTIMLKGEKGNSVARVEKTSTSGLVDTYTIYLTDGTIGGTFTVTNGSPVNIDDTVTAVDKTWSSNKLSGMIKNIDDSVVDADKLWSSQKINSMLAQTGTIEDVAIASFSDGADDVPLSELIVDIEAWQEGSGEPSHDNERAIHGWTECNLTRAGVNLFNGEIRNGYYASTTGIYAPNANMIANVTPIKVIGGSKIYIASATYLLGISEYDANMNFIRQSATIANAELTLSANTAFINFSNSWNSGSTYNDDIAINYPSNDTEYHAFEGETASISFDGNTVYKAKLNVLTGLMTILGVGADLASFAWTYNNGFFRTMNFSSSMKRPVNNSTPINALCSIYNCVSWNDCGNKDYEYGVNRENGELIIKDSRHSNVAEFVNAVNGVILVYELATSIEIQLTPVEVRTLLNCNIYADTGNIEKLVYFKAGSEAVARMIEAYMRAQPEE